MMWVHFFPSHKNLLVLVSGGKVVLLSDLLVIIKTIRDNSVFFAFFSYSNDVISYT
jgi:hypothetical protein